MSDPLLRCLTRLVDEADSSIFTAESIADIVWMARYLSSPAIDPEPSAIPARSDTPNRFGNVDRLHASRAPTSDDFVSDIPAQYRDVVEFHPINTAQPNHDATSRPLATTTRAPAVAALPDPLAIARALRPLKRRVDMPGRMRLDEEATADSFGHTGVVLPQFHPATERWLQVDIIVDTSVSMSVWLQAAAELRTLIEYHGAFRDVRTWTINGDDLIPALRPLSDSKRYANAYSPAELVDPRGRRAVLVVTDAVGLGWHAGAMAECLATWARSGPLAIFELLPRRMWHRTAIRPISVVGIMRQGDQSPFRVTRSDDALVDLANENTRGDWIPVLHVGSECLEPWAAMVGSDTARPAELFAIQPSRVQSDALSEQFAQSGPETVRRFRDLDASQEAVELAGYLAAAPLSLPIMRLVQHAMMPHSRPEHLAEVFLSGLLVQIDESAENNPDEVAYEFRDGIREQLLGGLTRSESLRVLDVLSSVSGVIADRFGGTLDFRALAVDTRESGIHPLSAKSRPFARIAAEVLRGVGGRYAELAASLENLLRVAEDYDSQGNRITDAISEVAGRATSQASVAGAVNPREWGAKYNDYRDWYEWQTERLADRIIDALTSAELEVFAVEWRTKEISSFIAKIEARHSGKGPVFTDPLREITDLIGVRIITYTLEDIAAVGKIIQRHFYVENTVTVDKSGDEVDRFNYKSVHYIIRITPPSSDPRDWGPYADVKAEIQVRTALQHAWSAVQHELDYKSDIAVPKEMQRRLFRLNAAIESADVEFSELRDERARIESSYRADVERGQLAIPLDEASITAYITDKETSEKITNLLRDHSDANIGPLAGKRLARDRKDLLSVLSWCGISTVEQFDEYLTASILPGRIPAGFFGDDQRSVEDALTILILTDKQADQQAYGRIYMPEGWLEFAQGVDEWRALNRRDATGLDQTDKSRPPAAESG